MHHHLVGPRHRLRHGRDDTKVCARSRRPRRRRRRRRRPHFGQPPRWKWRRTNKYLPAGINKAHHNADCTRATSSPHRTFPSLSPRAPHDNRGPWREFEAAIADCLSNSDAGSVTAKITWQFSYEDGDKQRPNEMTYSVQYTDSLDGTALNAERRRKGSCEDASKTFPNDGS